MSDTHRILALISEVREKANRIISDELNRNHMEGLAPSHGAILIQLYSKSEVCMKDLAQSVGKDKSTITALVNKLVKFGYVERVKSADDSRITFLVLTEKGRGTKKILHEISEKVLDQVYRNFEEDEKVVLCEKLEKISGNL